MSAPVRIEITEVHRGDRVVVGGKPCVVLDKRYVAGRDIPWGSLEAGWTDPHFLITVKRDDEKLMARVSAEGWVMKLGAA